MMHNKLFRTFVGLTLAVLLIGCTSSAGTTVPPMPSRPASTQAPAGRSSPTPVPEKVSSYEECLRAAGSLLQENYVPPQCVTKGRQVFKDKTGASTEAAPSTVGTKDVGGNAPAGSLSAQGPWLLYVHNSPRQGMYDLSDIAPELILLNKDGTGRTSIRLNGCFDQSIPSDTAAYLAKADIGLYLIQPGAATAKLVDEDRPYPTCPTYFNGDEKNGLLASITEDADPELVLFELPAGKIRDRFPLVSCSGDVEACNTARSLWDTVQFLKPRPQWSPNGRYLAFAALQDASSDLFVYDSQDGSLRRLTSGPDWVGPIEWSPDGTHIIMQEILNEDLLNYSSDIPSSVWSVSVSGNDVKLLYQTDAEYMGQTILQWLDDHSFIAYEGTQDPSAGSLKPRFVDLDSGTSRLLFDDWFGAMIVDPVHQTIALVKQPTEKSPDGVYLISLESGTIRRVGDGSEYLAPNDWDPHTGLFVSGSPCQDDPQGLQAFDYQGNLRCVPQPAPTSLPTETEYYPAPDGKQTLTVKDGLWLERKGQAEIRISPEVASDVTWCPDSSCFFFLVPQSNGTWTLNHVSLPDMTLKTVEDGIQTAGSYQWLRGEP